MGRTARNVSRRALVRSLLAELEHPVPHHQRAYAVLALRRSTVRSGCAVIPQSARRRVICLPMIPIACSSTSANGLRTVL